MVLALNHYEAQGAIPPQGMQLVPTCPHSAQQSMGYYLLDPGEDGSATHPCTQDQHTSETAWAGGWGGPSNSFPFSPRYTQEGTVFLLSRLSFRLSYHGKQKIILHLKFYPLKILFKYISYLG